MPPLPNYPNVLKVTHRFTVGADASVGTTLHYSYTGTAPSDATCVTIAADIYALMTANLGPVISTANTMQGVTVSDLTSPTAGFGEHNAATDGSRAGDVLPASTCALLHMPIARRYRGGKPRSYWPFGVASDLVNPSAWASISQGDFQTAMSGLVVGTEALSVAGTILGVLVSVSYYSGFTAVVNPITGRTRDVPKVRSAAIAPDLILSPVILPVPATQRRRAMTP